MVSRPQIGHAWVRTISRIWQKRAGPPDFVWIARFRLPPFSTIFKSFLFLAACMIGMKLSHLAVYATHDHSVLFWVGVTLGLSAAVLLLGQELHVLSLVVSAMLR